MPLAGATAPVTLVGSVVQHAAECISGITIHQLAQPGAPIVWGGAPAIFDMRTGKTPMGAIETAMLDLACSQVGKYLGLPTHAYLVAGDGRVIDAQVEMESGISTVLGALAGINMISGAGMLDFLACHSIEKLVIDAEAIASAQRLIEGIQPRSDSLAVAMFAQTGLQGDFLTLKETRALFRKEQHFPSAVIDRGLPTMDGTNPDILQRARQRVERVAGQLSSPSAVGRSRTGSDCLRPPRSQTHRPRSTARDPKPRVRPVASASRRLWRRRLASAAGSVPIQPGLISPPAVLQTPIPCRSSDCKTA